MNISTTKKTKYPHHMIWITDPGHGWLKIKREEYKESQIEASGHSYYDDKYVYLEEDADAQLYLNAKNLDPRLIRVKFQYRESPIRNLNHTPIEETN